MSEKCNTSIKAAKSVLDAINIYFEMLNMREIRSVLIWMGQRFLHIRKTFQCFLLIYLLLNWKYINILANLGETRKSLRFQGSQVTYKSPLQCSHTTNWITNRRGKGSVRCKRISRPCYFPLLPSQIYTSNSWSPIW